jgi:MFS family permease
VQVRLILYATAFLRAVGTSATGLFLGIHLGQRGHTPAEVGSVVSAGLAGTALSAALATFFGDRFDKRAWLIGLTLLTCVGTVSLLLVDTTPTLCIAAFAGMLNGAGRDRGAALILEQAVLPTLTTAERRTSTIAGYTLLQDVGHGLGALLPGAFVMLPRTRAGEAPAQLTLLSIAGLGLVSVALYAASGARLEPVERLAAKPLSNRSRGILLRICALFGIDSLAGGFLTTALMSYFFFERFGVGVSVIGPLFFGARLLNAVSHVGAAWLARRIGLVNTMVFTHIPSSFLLVSVAFAPNLTVAVILFLLREGLVEMDVPTRQSYVLAVVEPSERTFASGITNLVRLGGWAVAPAFAGALMQGQTLYLPLVVGAAMKIAYDLLLWRAFRSIRPPEEKLAA